MAVPREGLSLALWDLVPVTSKSLKTSWAGPEQVPVLVQLEPVLQTHKQIKQALWILPLLPGSTWV
jgi:hypothetical protein